MLVEGEAEKEHSTASHQEERAALARVLESRYFAKAPLLSSFLSYACNLALAGEGVRITEQAIGVMVFHRPEGYDPGEDNIVRNYARQLRRRLDDYYLNEGRADSLRIDMPRGGYVANFRRHALDASALKSPAQSLATSVEGSSEANEDGLVPPPNDSITPPPTPAPQGGRWQRWTPLLCSFLLGGLTAFAVWHYAHRTSRSPLHTLWAQIFQADQDTVVVPADVGFVILQQLNNRTFSLAEYESWSSVEQYDHVYMSFLKAQKYTSMLDLDTVSRLQRLPEVVPSRFFAHAARSLSTEDLSNDNLILLGSSYSNPWVEVFERNLNFRFVTEPRQGRLWIENTHPLMGEAARYENTVRNMTHETYAVIALLPNLSKSGHVLIVEGLDGPGTQAAVDLLLRGDQVQRILKRATRPDKTLGGFELLLTATSIDTRATGTHIIAERYYP
jgi:hypothetical protein